MGRFLTKKEADADYKAEVEALNMKFCPIIKRHCDPRCICRYEGSVRGPTKPSLSPYHQSEQPVHPHKPYYTYNPSCEHVLITGAMVVTVET